MLNKEKGRENKTIENTNKMIHGRKEIKRKIKKI
jgi:hypothetical protein